MAAGSRTHAERHMAKHVFVEPLSIADVEAVTPFVKRITAKSDDPACHIIVDQLTILLIAGDLVSLQRAREMLVAILAPLTGHNFGGTTWETF